MPNFKIHTLFIWSLGESALRDRHCREMFAVVRQSSSTSASALSGLFLQRAKVQHEYGKKVEKEFKNSDQ